MNDAVRQIFSSIPRNYYYNALPIISLLFMNIFILSSCSFLGCYDVSFTNIFRANLICNACTDISYNLQKHQIQIYLCIGGYLLKRANEVIDKQVKNISPSKDWG